jgi:hypothetical protein
MNGSSDMVWRIVRRWEREAEDLMCSDLHAAA